MKKDRITELIAISLITTLFNTTGIFSAEPEQPVQRISDKIFYHSDPANRVQKEVSFAISDGVKKIHEFVGRFLTGLYNPYCPDGINYKLLFEDNLDGIVITQRAAVDSRLAAAPNLESARILTFFDGICSRIRRVYQPFFARFNELRQRCIENPFRSDFSDSYTEVYINPIGAIDIGTTSLSKGSEVAQLTILQDICNLSLDVDEAKAFAPTVTQFDTYQLLLHVTGADQVSLNDKVYLKNKDICRLYTAYGDFGSTEEVISGLEFAAAPRFKLLTKNISGKVRFYMPDASANLFVKIEFVDSDAKAITPAHIIDELGRRASYKVLPDLPPPPKHICMFTEADDVMLRQIADTDTQIQLSLQKSGKTPAGWSRAEEIMDYGSNERTSITPEVRQGVQTLLHDQFKRRGMVPQPIKDVVFEKNYQKFTGQFAVIETLKTWFTELNLGNIAELNRSLDYVARNYFISIENAGLLVSLWSLRNMHDFYSKWPNPVEREQFLEQMAPTIFQSLSHLEMHNGKCGTGARGRNFLIDLGMLRFFNESHPNLEVVT